MKRIYLLAIGALLSGNALYAQGTLNDYQRAFSLSSNFKDKVFYSDVNPQWIGNTNQFWYVRNTPQGKVYVVTDAVKKTRKELFDHQKLAKLLASSAGQTIDATKLPLQELQVNPSMDTLRFIYNNFKWMYLSKKSNLVNEGRVVKPEYKYWNEWDDERVGDPVVSPDGKLTAFIKNQNIYKR